MKLTKQQKKFLKVLVNNKQPFRMINLKKKQIKAVIKYLKLLPVSLCGNETDYYMDSEISVDTWLNEYFVATPTEIENQQQPIIDLFYS